MSSVLCVVTTRITGFIVGIKHEPHTEIHIHCGGVHAFHLQHCAAGPILISKPSPALETVYGPVFFHCVSALQHLIYTQ